jgi:hypothetical protein
MDTITKLLTDRKNKLNEETPLLRQDAESATIKADANDAEVSDIDNQLAALNDSSVKEAITTAVATIATNNLANKNVETVTVTP